MHLLLLHSFHLLVLGCIKTLSSHNNIPLINLRRGYKLKPIPFVPFVQNVLFYVGTLHPR